nr:hypothetical protein [Tanacetum cinerariifolium]
PRPHGDSMRPSFRPAGHRPHGPSINPRRPIMNSARPYKSFFQAPSYETRPFLKSSEVKNPYRAPWVPTVNSSQSNIDDKDSECIVLGRNFKPLDDANILLRTPKQHNMYSIDLNNIVSHKDLTCLVAKASADECILWHRRLGKQHKASCKSKLVNSVTKPLHNLHMSKDETSDILKKFITEVENLKDYNVKIISNARTPQHNGVAKRRNKTLIEAARTMLANAKLPVTFWDEAVNTTCYVQNRVLVNKSQNKTPYEIFNGRTPVIGFLKPFGCHVMILNTLENLGKFEAKGDEGYFIGYSMSSKAFRVFNKRAIRVEKNLHVEFLENKAIEKGVGPNWYKRCSKSKVKKDVSFLRYIVLPNWAHDALLESSSSKPHDESSSQVPKGSGNPNPTVSSSNPLAYQMETLTVESPIPIVISPVSTACLNDSPEPSSEARLISKRVANQEETPSLDNILSLTNRFEYILGVTTSSDETIGVEADVSNMETSILASLTLTLRIHKDHPKSQIIGPVNTPIQTRHKSKMMEEQSFIATIHQKTDPALL